MRIREVVTDLMARLKSRFPDAELLSVDEWATGMVVLHVFTKHKDGGDLIEAVLDRVTEILVDDEISIAIVPEREKSAKRAA